MNAITKSVPIGRPNSAPTSPVGFEPGAATVRKGRGAATLPANRFDALATSPFDDGWAAISACVDLAPLPTELIRDSSRSVISYNQSPDVGFDRSVNPYRGCEHGCVYCYARPTHAYLGYSPGLDFETKLLYKPDVAQLLEQEIGKPNYQPKPIVLGSNTDPYQPVERTLQLTRSVLQVLSRYNHPVSIVTKSAGVLRDIELLKAMAEKQLVRVYLSITTLDNDLARRMEPRAAAPSRRLQAVAELAKVGVPTGVLAAPMIPGLNDSELESILGAASQAKASHAGYVLLRLPLEVATIFETWLKLHYPDRARHVLSLIRDTRAGALNDSKFGQRFCGRGVYADLLARRFERASRQYGFKPRHDLDCSMFVKPSKPTAANAQNQLSLL